VITILGPGTASGINNLGQIVGSGSIGGGFPSAMIWSKNAPPIVLDDLEGGGGSGSNGLGINDAGQVVGWSTTPGNPFTNVPTIWNGVTPTQLPSLGTLEGQASAINNNGQATGYSNIGTLSDASIRAMLWQGNSVTDLGTLNGSNNSIGRSINDAGQVVGSSTVGPTGSDHAFLWSNGVMIDLGTLGGVDAFSSASDINHSGQIVGGSTFTPDDEGVAVIWDNGQICDLNSFLDASLVQEGWVLAGANAINDSGQILAFMVNTQLGGGRNALLTPVPEPETYAMLVAGLGLLGLTASKRKAPALCTCNDLIAVSFLARKGGL
jgi:probable HAF family extracellular repeat protein